jgi:hypothetical protein
MSATSHLHINLELWAPNVRGCVDILNSFLIKVYIDKAVPPSLFSGQTYVSYATASLH